MPDPTFDISITLIPLSPLATYALLLSYLDFYFNNLLYSFLYFKLFLTLDKTSFMQSSMFLI